MDLNCKNISNRNKNNDKNLFIKNLSLELANTINGLDGFLNLFNKNNLSEREKELLCQAKYATFILSYQVKSLKHLQELENATPQINFICFNLCELISNSLSFFKKEFLHKKINISFDNDPNTPLFLYGDSLKLNEIINSLIENSFILASNYINFYTKIIKKENEKITINFKLIFDTTSIKKEPQNNFIFDNLTATSEFKKTDINFALSNELLKQLNSQLFYDTEEKEIIISFDITFFNNNQEQM